MLPSVIGQPRNAGSPYVYERRDTETLANNIGALGRGIGRMAIGLSAEQRQSRDNDMALMVRNYKVQLDTLIDEKDTGTDGQDWGVNGQADALKRQQKAREIVFAQFPNADHERFEKEVFSIDAQFNQRVRAKIKATEKARTVAANAARDNTAGDLYAFDGDIDALIGASIATCDSDMDMATESMSRKYAMYSGIDTTNINWGNDEQFNKFCDGLKRVDKVVIDDEEYRVVEDNDTRTREGIGGKTISRSELLGEAAGYRAYQIDRATVRDGEVVKKVSKQVKARVNTLIGNGDYDGARETLDNARLAAAKYNLPFMTADFVALDNSIRQGEAISKGVENASMFVAKLPVGDDGYMDVQSMNKLEAEIGKVNLALQGITDKTARQVLVAKRQTLIAQQEAAKNRNAIADTQTGEEKMAEFKQLRSQGMPPWQALAQAYGQDDCERTYFSKAYKLAVTQSAIETNAQREADAPMRQADLEARRKSLAQRMRLAEERNDRAEMAQLKREQERLAKAQSIEQKAAWSYEVAKVCEQQNKNNAEEYVRQKEEIESERTRKFDEGRNRLIKLRNEHDAALLRSYDNDIQEAARSPELTDRGRPEAMALANIVADGIRAEELDAKTLMAIQLYTKSTGRADFVFDPGSTESKEQIKAMLEEDVQYRAEHPTADLKIAEYYQRKYGAKSFQLEVLANKFAREKSHNDTQFQEAVEALDNILQQECDAKMAKASKLYGATAVLNPEMLGATSDYDDFVRGIPDTAFQSPMDRLANGNQVRTWRHTQELTAVNILASARGGKVSAGGMSFPCSSEEDMLTFCRLNNFTGDEATRIVKRVKTHGADMRIAQDVLKELAAAYDSDLETVSKERLAAAVPGIVNDLADYLHGQRAMYAGAGDAEKRLHDACRDRLLSMSGMRLDKKNIPEAGDNPRRIYLYGFDSSSTSNNIRGLAINEQDNFKNLFRGLAYCVKKLDVTNPDKYGDSYEGMMTLAWDSTEASQIINGDPRLRAMVQQLIDDTMTANEREVRKIGK